MEMEKQTGCAWGSKRSTPILETTAVFPVHVGPVIRTLISSFINFLENMNKYKIIECEGKEMCVKKKKKIWFFKKQIKAVVWFFLDKKKISKFDDNKDKIRNYNDNEKID